MEWKREGTAWVYGDHLCGDDLIGGPEVVNADIYDPETLGALLLENLDPGFHERARPGDFLVAGVNFGFSKAHQQFYIALKSFGIGGVIASSFQPFLMRAFPFYGIPYLVLPNAPASIQSGDHLTVDFRQGTVGVRGRSATLQGRGIPDLLVPTYQAGDPLSYFRSKLDAGAATP